MRPLFFALVAASSLVACPRPDWTPPNLSAPIAGNAANPTNGATPAGTAAKPGGTRAAGAQVPAAVAPPPQRDFSKGVTITLEANDGYPERGKAPSDLAFALPLPAGAVAKLERIEVHAEGKKLGGVRMRPLLYELGADGAKKSVRSVMIELPSGAVRLPGNVEIRFNAAADQPVTPSRYSFAALARPAPVMIETARYGVEPRGTSTYAAVARERGSVKAFDSVAIPTRAIYPLGYVAATRILGDVMTRPELDARPELTGMAFLSNAFSRFADSAMGISTFPVNPDAVKFETEAWLYDRCTTYLLSYAHAGDKRHLAHGLASCAHYARQIGSAGDRRGIFAGKQDRDTKYSHARGLYAYYALSGDETAFEAGKAIAEMWDADQLFAVPYRAGSTRGYDKLWTERLLATAIEGGIYGFLLTGEARFLESARGLVKTAIRHITTNDANELKTITKTQFPPQSCFIHNALQQAEGNADIPWCSSWMSELVVDPLLRYQEVTGERAIDEVFVRLARSMRDAGTTYFRNNPLNDSFLNPSRPFVMEEDARLLAPLYGYGIGADGKRKASGEWSDFEHCPDATAITAAALRALRRQNKWDAAPTPASAAFPVDLSRFRTEADSFIALHHEFAFCASRAFDAATRKGRDPMTANASTLAQAYNAGDEKGREKALSDSKIGWPVYHLAPMRKLSWWFNTSIGEFSWLVDAKAPFPTVRPGQIR